MKHANPVPLLESAVARPRRDNGSDTRDQEIAALKSQVDALTKNRDYAQASAEETLKLVQELEVARAETEAARHEAYAARATIEKLALHDPLTGIANRNQFLARMHDALAHAKRGGAQVAVMQLDLDGLKGINDSFGHPVGDHLLRFAADKLRESTRETDTVARLGGDEFAVILTDMDRPDRPAMVAERVVRQLSEDIVLDGCLISTGMSIGIALSPQDGVDAEQLLSNADTALQAAKAAGPGIFRFFDAEMEAQAKAAHVLEMDMRLGIVRGEFELNFQPQLNAGSNALIGVEALIRWNHPTRGRLGPNSFIPAAEANGLIIELGKMVLRDACRQCREWLDHGHMIGSVSVNISSVQFKSQGFVEFIEKTLSETGLDPVHLELEITESAMMEDVEKSCRLLGRLRELGVHLSIDDFGTGYSSLAYLKRLPISRLKIDKSFVDNLAVDANDLAIAEAVVTLGHVLGLDVIAEGVETGMQADKLKEKGCDQLQGFLFAKPLSVGDFEDWMSHRAAA